MFIATVRQKRKDVLRAAIFNFKKPRGPGRVESLGLGTNYLKMADKLLPNLVVLSSLCSLISAKETLEDKSSSTIVGHPQLGEKHSKKSIIYWQWLKQIYEYQIMKFVKFVSAVKVAVIFYNLRRSLSLPLFRIENIEKRFFFVFLWKVCSIC